MTAALLAALCATPVGHTSRLYAIRSDRPQPFPTVTPRVGTIRVEGNSRTDDRGILALFPPAFDPGRPLPSRAEFDRLERKLLAKFADVDAGRWPSILIAAPVAGSTFLDLRVRFPERGPGER